MQRTITIASLAFASFGLSFPVLAQAESNLSPAQQLGVQERSIQTDAKATRTVRTSVNPAQPVEQLNEGGLVLYRIDRNTRVLVGPARGSTPTADLQPQAQQGDNRLQLLHDLEQ